MSRAKKTHFPLFVSSENKPVLVVGGGKIAERRVQTLLEFSFAVTVISPTLTDTLTELSQVGAYLYHNRPFEQQDIAGMYLVVAATNDREVNRTIGALCKEQQILVSVADKKEECTFYFPAVVLDDQLVIGITTEGKSHKRAAECAALLRERFADED